MTPEPAEQPERPEPREGGERGDADVSPENPERLEPPRTPNFTRYLVVGAVLGFVVGAAIALVGPDAGNYTSNTAIGYLGVFGAVIGLALGGLVAIVLDWLRHRSGPQT